jgi:hypothetical protein
MVVSDTSPLQLPRIDQTDRSFTEALRPVLICFSAGRTEDPPGLSPANYFSRFAEVASVNRLECIR